MCKATEYCYCNELGYSSLEGVLNSRNFECLQIALANIYVYNKILIYIKS